MPTHNPADWTLADCKVVTNDEVHRILTRAKKLSLTDDSWKRDYEWFAIAVNTGLRLSEVAHIEKGDVLDSGRLMVIRRKKKTLHPAPIEVMPDIYALIKARADAVESGWIFPGNAQPCLIHRISKYKGPRTEQVCIGGHSSLRTIQRRWRILVTELGLYKYGRGIHSLRHSAITNVYALTKDLRKAQVFAGHSNSAITERYAHVTDMKETLAKLPTML